MPQFEDVRAASNSAYNNYDEELKSQRINPNPNHYVCALQYLQSPTRPRQRTLTKQSTKPIAPFATYSLSDV